ncbi:urease accessory protein UreE [Deinococcus sp. KNUC1210]|uniref:urease accessory protein UreE n=1 Tax=Deinococcus sp. KNUC1210 TaxID=2917691 RepID=UPI001EF00D45|nr:urease accessory protein UreE [Deinococcus sp. KNUC1210]ULH14385.1 urease accessory protein UreE [Deinococcus sp. KNUC1210]
MVQLRARAAAAMTRRLSGLGLRLEARQAETPVPSGAALVEVPMTALDRRRVRRRLTVPDGTELLLAFPTGTYLAPGSVLETRGNVAYVVTAAPEDVAAIRPVGMAQAARVAHAVGNLHRDFVEDGEVFLALWDAPIELLLTRLGVPFTREHRPFLGRPAWEHDE